MGLSLATQIALAIAGAALASVGILAVIAPYFTPGSRRHFAALISAFTTGGSAIIAMI